MSSEFDDVANMDEVRRDRKMSDTLRKLYEATEAFDRAFGLEYAALAEPGDAEHQTPTRPI